MRKARWMMMTGAVVILSSCIIPIYMDEGSRFGGNPAAFSKTIPFAPGGVLSVDNGLGDIVIRGWDRDELEVTAEETWADSSGRDVSIRLPRGNAVVPRVTVDASDRSVKIKARPRDPDFEDDRAVRLVIQVPHDVELRDIAGRRGRIDIADLYGRIRLDLEEGDILVENFSGSLEADLIRGSIQAEILDSRPDDTVRLVLKQGTATVLLEPGFNGRIEASAPNGTVTSDFIVEPPLEGRRAAGTIGTGQGAMIIVSTLNGDVRLRKSK
jgi:hypothetical protein